MSRYKIILLLLCSLLGLIGCTDLGLFVVNRLAAFSDYSAIENIPYGSDKLQRLSVYSPENLPANDGVAPATIIFFYGGCWGGCRTLNKESYLFVAEAITSRGYNAILVDYRRHPAVKFPEIIDDARRAVEWVHRNIEQYGGDSELIFIMGHSAGAHLGAMLTLDETYLDRNTYQAIKGFIGLSGPYDFLPHTEPYQYAVFGPETRYAESQPINYVDGTEPPLLLLYGEDDTQVKSRNIINLARKVRMHGGTVETHFYDGIDHAEILAALSIPLQSTTPVIDDIFNFVKQRLQ
ncbi:MAG: alpha/beta hydrolase [Gammaproteobacteria bacterium]|nr:alpha/beta hydrolase [Gammaproteobacteria bacterium]